MRYYSRTVDVVVALTVTMMVIALMLMLITIAHDGVCEVSLIVLTTRNQGINFCSFISNDSCSEKLCGLY